MKSHASICPPQMAVLFLLSVAHHHVGVDESKGVDDDFALHRLDGINHDGDSPEIGQKINQRQCE